MEYPLLFSEGMIGKVAIRNRVVMAAMAIGMAEYDGTPSEKLIDYYEERARNGLGLLVTEATRVEYWHGSAMPRQLSMTNDRHIAPFATMTDRLHAHGTKVFCQLHHPGNQGLSLMGIFAPMFELTGRVWPGYYSMLPKFVQFTGQYPAVGDWMIDHMRIPAVVSASRVPCSLNNQRTRALRRSEIVKLVQNFARAARRVQLARGDGVELHAAHGYIIEQFLSTHTNQRRDEYGGSLENRMRFLREIIGGIRRECGNDFPIMVRLSVDDFYRCIGKPGQGIELEEGVEMARRLEKAGIDAINVSSGTYETANYTMEPMSFECGWRKHLAGAVKEVVTIPVVAANLIRMPEQAEAQLAEGIQDFIALGRPLLADPAWTSKAEEGRAEEIRRCISCLYCFESLMANVVSGFPAECTVNPCLGREKETTEPRRDGAGRTVAVIGAGPAGLEAAEILGERGFKAVVIESSDSAGGQLKLAGVPPKKDKINWCIQDLEGAARRGGAEIRFGTEASTSVIEALDPYAVIAATGAQPIVPDLPGVERENVCTVNAVLEGKVKLQGKTVAVIGSGLTGLETGEKLAEDGNNVLVVEMLDEIGPGAYSQNLQDILGRLEEGRTEFLTSHKLVEIGEDGITLEDVKSGRRTTRQVDAVVLSVGVRSDDRLARELKARFARVCTVGDAHQTGRIHDAVLDGFDTAWSL